MHHSWSDLFYLPSSLIMHHPWIPLPDQLTSCHSLFQIIFPPTSLTKRSACFTLKHLLCGCCPVTREQVAWPFPNSILLSGVCRGWGGISKTQEALESQEEARRSFFTQTLCSHKAHSRSKQFNY